MVHGRAILPLSRGTNYLPQLYNPSIAVRDQEPQVVVTLAISPRQETMPGYRPGPEATTVVMELAWEDALRLAWEICRMAVMCDVSLPAGMTMPADPKQWLPAS